MQSDIVVKLTFLKFPLKNVSMTVTGITLEQNESQL